MTVRYRFARVFFGCVVERITIQAGDLSGAWEILLELDLPAWDFFWDQ